MAVKGLTLLLIVLYPFCYGNPLPSWNEGEAKQAIIRFVEESVKNTPVEERIATFDQDGTLWVEKPYYPQLAFALDTTHVPREELEKLSKKEIESIVAESHSGMTIEAFQNSVRKWLQTALQPRFKKPYTELVYQPMLEVLKYFQDNGFKTYIVSGGGQEFIRTYADKVYHIPPEQIIGSTAKVRFDYNEGNPVLIKEKEILFIDDKGGKPESINLIIGKRPLAAFGNSEGDREMLEWSKGFRVLIDHDDASREYAYPFSPSLSEQAKKQGWIVVSMKRDWGKIFPP